MWQLESACTYRHIYTRIIISIVGQHQHLTTFNLSIYHHPIGSDIYGSIGLLCLFFLCVPPSIFGMKLIPVQSSDEYVLCMLSSYLRTLCSFMYT